MGRKIVVNYSVLILAAASCYKHSVPDQTLMRSPLVIVTSMTEKLGNYIKIVLA